MCMLDKTKIDQIAETVATANLTTGSVNSVDSSSTVDPDGKDALLIKIVLTPGSSDGITGDAALDTLTGILRSLQEQGDERFPIIEYEELGEGADSQS
jgi:hypothetical protein